MRLTPLSILSILAPASVVTCAESPSTTTTYIYIHDAVTTVTVISMHRGTSVSRAAEFSTSAHQAVDHDQPEAASPSKILISHIGGSQKTMTDVNTSLYQTAFEAADSRPISELNPAASSHAFASDENSDHYTQAAILPDHDSNDSNSARSDTVANISRVEAEEEGSHAEQSSASYESGESHVSDHDSEGEGEEAPAHDPIDDSNPVHRLKYAKHWRIDLPLWFIPVVFFLPLALTVLGMWLVHGGHHKHPHDFFSTLKYRGDLQRPFDVTLAQQYGHERQAAWQMRTEIRQREVEEAAFAQGDPGAVARHEANEEETRQSQQRAHRAAYRLQVKQRRQLKKHLRVSTEDERIRGESEESVSMDQYHSAVQTSMRAQVRRRAVGVSPVDAPPSAERMWMP